MNPFDAAILHFINGFAHRWWTLDYFMVWLQGDGFQKGGLVALLFWWAWFQVREDSRTVRETLVCAAVAAPLALALSRLISHLLTFRLRPIHDPDLHIQLAYTMAPDALIGWSAFPSDHAAVFFALVTGLFLVSRPLGWLGLAHVLLLVCLPRVFLGIHYPTDIIGGAVLGVLVVWLACLPAVKAAIARPILNWMNLHPPSFYACAFFYTCQFAVAFGWVRDIIVLVRKLVSGVGP